MHLRSRASLDIDDAIEHLRGSAGDDIAHAWVDALESALRTIARSPNAGSLQLGYELGIPELRMWGLERFDHVVFHVAIGDRIDVWRVLHSRRDVPATFADDR